MSFLALDPGFEASKSQSSGSAGRRWPFPGAGAATQYLPEAASVPEVGLVSVLPRRLQRCFQNAAPEVLMHFQPPPLEARGGVTGASFPGRI